MRTNTKRTVTAVLAASAAVVGGWAQFAPRSFYVTMPWPGRHWVSKLGPYNEHLTRDVGGLYLALLAISVWTLLRPRDESFLLVGLAWTVFSIPHLIFHLLHLDMFGPFDQAGNVVTLGATAVLAVSLLLPTHPSKES